MLVKAKIVYTLTSTKHGADLAFFTNDDGRKRLALLKLSHAQIGELASRLLMCACAEERDEEGAEGEIQQSLSIEGFPH